MGKYTNKTALQIAFEKNPKDPRFNGKLTDKQKLLLDQLAKFMVERMIEDFKKEEELKLSKKKKIRVKQSIHI